MYQKLSDNKYLQDTKINYFVFDWTAKPSEPTIKDFLGENKKMTNFLKMRTSKSFNEVFILRNQFKKNVNHNMGLFEVSSATLAENNLNSQ